MRLCKKIIRIVTLASIILVLVSSTVLAAYSYYATVQVQETGGNSYSYLPIIADIDNDYLANNGYISLTGLDTRILSGSTELEHLVVDDSVLFVVPSVGANSTGNYRYTLGNSLQDDFPIITGVDGYITITDDDTLDGGVGGMDDFEIELKGYVDTDAGTNKSLVAKPLAFAIYISAEDSIRAAILSSGAPTSVNLVPNAAGDIQELHVYPSGDAWAAVDDPPGAADDATTYILDDAAAVQKASFNLENGSIPAGADITSVVIYFRFRSQNASGTAYCRPYLILDGEETLGAEESLASVTWTDYNETLARPGGGSWQIPDIYRLQAGVQVRVSDTDYEVQVTQVYVKVNYTPAVEDKAVTVTSITSGERIATASADGINLVLSVTDYSDVHLGNSPQTIALAGASVPDNADDWLLDQNNVMPYMEYYKHTVSDTLIAWYQPISMIVGTTLDDREGTDAGETGTAEEDGAITWGTNPANLSATIGSLISSSQPEISPASEEEAVDVVPEGEITEGGVVNVSKLDSNPLYPIVAIISEHTSYTEEQIWFIGATFIILIGMGLAAISVPNHLLLAGTIGLVLSGFLRAMEIYQWWMMLIFGFMFVMTILMERKPVL